MDSLPASTQPMGTDAGTVGRVQVQDDPAHGLPSSTPMTREATTATKGRQETAIRRAMLAGLQVGARLLDEDQTKRCLRRYATDRDHWRGVVLRKGRIGESWPGDGRNSYPLVTLSHDLHVAEAFVAYVRTIHGAYRGRPHRKSAASFTVRVEGSAAAALLEELFREPFTAPTEVIEQVESLLESWTEKQARKRRTRRRNCRDCGGFVADHLDDDRCRSCRGRPRAQRPCDNDFCGKPVESPSKFCGFACRRIAEKRRQRAESEEEVRPNSLGRLDREVDHAAFDELTPEVRYWSGVLYAGGAIYFGAWIRVEMPCQHPGVVEHLEELRRFVNGPDPVETFNRSDRAGMRRWARLVFQSDRIAKRLDDYGLLTSPFKVLTC